MNRASPRRDGHRRRALQKWTKRALLGILAAGGLAALAKSLAPKPVPVERTEAARGRFVVTVDEDGRARVEDRYVVRAPIPGRLARLGLEPGDDVDEGEVLARIVPLEAPLLDARARSSAEARVAAARARIEQTRAQVARAEAALELAAAEAQRLERLGAEDVIAPRELDRARARRRTAEAELDSARFARRVAEHELRTARAALGRYEDGDAAPEALEVTAPAAGRVLEVKRESGGAVALGAPLLVIGDTRRLEVVVDVLTQDAVEIAPGARVTLERWGGPALEARVKRVEPSAFTRRSALGVEEQRVNVIVGDFETSPAAARLGDGWRVEARIVVWASDDALTVPASAVFRRDGGWAVFTVEADTARETAVELGRRNGRKVQVTSGLEAGDVVVAHPSEDVQDGVEVAVRDGGADTAPGPRPTPPGRARGDGARR
jgi:HlyD family secretion protein